MFIFQVRRYQDFAYQPSLLRRLLYFGSEPTRTAALLLTACSVTSLTSPKHPSVQVCLGRASNLVHYVDRQMALKSRLQVEQKKGV